MRAGNCFTPGSDQNKGLLSTFTVKVRCKSEGGKKKDHFCQVLRLGFRKSHPCELHTASVSSRDQIVQGSRFLAPGQCRAVGQGASSLLWGTTHPTQASCQAWGPGFAFGSQLCAGWTCWGSSWRLMINRGLKTPSCVLGSNVWQ